MKEHVTVIPSDGLIICDGMSLPCEFVPHLDTLHALQWHDGRGHIELKENGVMKNIPIVSYETDVLPYVDIWQTVAGAMKTISAEEPEKPEESGPVARSAVSAISPLSGATVPTAGRAVSGTAIAHASSSGKTLYPYGPSVRPAGPDGAAGGLSAPFFSPPDSSGAPDDDAIPGKDAAPHVVASGGEGTDWYRQWSDGWLEQGGQRTIAPRGSVEVGFPVPFGTVLHIGITPQYYTGERNHAAGIGLSAQAPSGFTACQCSEKKGCHWNGFVWYACGESR